MTFLRRLGRAFLLRCPNCGGGHIRSGIDLVADCPTCHHHFERHEGYWLGAVMLNTAAVIVAFLSRGFWSSTTCISLSSFAFNEQVGVVVVVVVLVVVVAGAGAGLAVTVTLTASTTMEDA